MKPKTKMDKPPILTLTFNWSGDIPKKVKATLKAMCKPKTITLKLPKG